MQVTAAGATKCATPRSPAGRTCRLCRDFGRDCVARSHALRLALSSCQKILCGAMSKSRDSRRQQKAKAGQPREESQRGNARRGHDGRVDRLGDERLDGQSGHDRRPFLHAAVTPIRRPRRPSKRSCCSRPASWAWRRSRCWPSCGATSRLKPPMGFVVFAALRGHRAGHRHGGSADDAVATQNSAFPGVRGNGITSRMFAMPVTNCTIRSRPRPKPECGTVPKRRRSRYHQ